MSKIGKKYNITSTQNIEIDNLIYVKDPINNKRININSS